MEAAEQTSTRGILNDLRPIRSPIGWVPSRRPVLQGVCVVTGVRRAVPQDLPVAVEVESSYYYSISSYFTYSVFVGRGTGHRDGDHGANAATRTREEARNWSKIASTWSERIRRTKIGKVVLPCPIRWYVVIVSGYLKRHSVRRRKILRNITDSFVRLSLLLERTTSFWNGASMVRGFDTSSSYYL